MIKSQRPEIFCEKLTRSQYCSEGGNVFSSPHERIAGSYPGLTLKLKVRDWKSLPHFLPWRLVIRDIHVPHPAGETEVRPIRLSCRIVRRSCKRSLKLKAKPGEPLHLFLLSLTPEKRQKKTPEERFEVRHSIWRAMPLLLAKRRALFRRELDLYRPHCCFCGNQSYA